MPQTPTQNLLVTARRRLFGEREGALVAAGLSTCTLLMGVLGASGWWTLHTNADAIRSGRQKQVESIAQLVAHAAEFAIPGNDLSGLRLTVSEAARNNDLSVCRVLLPDGSVLADAQPSAITARKLPSPWPGATPLVTEASGVAQITESGVSLRIPVDVTGMGRAVVEVTGDVSVPRWSRSDAQGGVAAIAAAGMGGLLIVYRAMRRRWRMLGAAHEALGSLASGTQDPGLLTLGPSLGPEAEAWNRLIGEWASLRSGRRIEQSLAATDSSGPQTPHGALACDTLAQGVLVVDDTGIVRYANGAAAVLLKSARERLVTQPIGSVLDDAQVKNAIGAACADPARGRVTVESRTQGDGAEFSSLRYTIRPLRSPGGDCVLVVIEDVTQQRIADDSRNAFVAQATHELRTPLTNIRLYTDSLAEDDGTDPRVRARCLNVISLESRRLERIVGDMLSVAEIEAGALKLHLGEVRTETLFEELRADYAPMAQDKELTLTFELPPKFPVLQGDRDKIMLALHNLVGNALKYTPAGGKVSVSAREDGASFCVDVADNGIGIRPEEQERVFERFYRAKDSRITGITGSGIGLALARQVVRMHGGDITVRSQLDKGSTFSLSVPLAQATSVRAAA